MSADLLPSLIFAVGFLSPWMLAWGLGIAVPIAVHLWRRQHRREIAWPAMRFLIAAIQKKSRRTQFEQWLLLALRCLAILGLSIAVAQPFVASKTLIGLGAGRTPTWTVLILDASFSMNHQGLGTSPWNEAQAWLDQFFSGRVEGDAVAFIEMSEPSTAIIPVASRNIAKVREATKNSAVLDTTADLSATLQLAIEVASQSKLVAPEDARFETIFLSDLGANTWSAMEQPEVEQLFQKLASVSSIELIPCQPEEFAPNLAVMDLRIEPSMPYLGQSANIWARIRNFSDKRLNEIPVQLLIDGRTIISRSVDFDIESECEVVFDWTPGREGNHILEVALAPDGLLNDNQRWLSIDVRQQSRILVFETVNDSSRFLRAALAPMGPDDDRSNLTVEARNIQRWRDVRFEDYQAIMLCDCRLPDNAFDNAIRSYLSSGGRLVVWFGDQSQRGEYDRWTESADQNPNLMPFRLNSISVRGNYLLDPRCVSNLRVPNSQLLGEAGGSGRFASRFLRVFADFPEGGLLTTPFYQYQKIQNLDPKRVAIELSFENNDPWILSSRWEAGDILWMTSPPTLNPADPERSWNALPAWPSFLPLVQELTLSLLESVAEVRNIRVGDAIEAFPASRLLGSIVVTRPDGTSFETKVPSGEDRSWRYLDTLRRGIYSLAMEQGDQFLHVAVNVDPTESDPRKFRSVQLPPSLQTSTIQGNHGNGAPVQDHSRWIVSILVTVLLLLLVETMYSAWMRRARQ